LAPSTEAVTYCIEFVLDTCPLHTSEAAPQEPVAIQLTL
jgi:hypothetical protein